MDESFERLISDYRRREGSVLVSALATWLLFSAPLLGAGRPQVKRICADLSRLESWHCSESETCGSRLHVAAWTPVWEAGQTDGMSCGSESWC